MEKYDLPDIDEAVNRVCVGGQGSVTEERSGCASSPFMRPISIVVSLWYMSISLCVSFLGKQAVFASVVFASADFDPKKRQI